MEPVTSDKDVLSNFVCEQNIERYEKLLKSHLTDMQRDFVESRLSEEKQALQLQRSCGD
jgi:hypothetical protein